MEAQAAALSAVLTVVVITVLWFFWWMGYQSGREAAYREATLLGLGQFNHETDEFEWTVHRGRDDAPADEEAPHDCSWEHSEEGFRAGRE